MSVHFSVRGTLVGADGSTRSTLQVGTLPTDRTLYETLSIELAACTDDFVELHKETMVRSLTIHLEVQS